MANEMRLIDIAQCEKYGHACLMYTEEDGSLVQTFTSAFPTIDPKTPRPEGHWVVNRESFDGYTHHRCSHCGTDAPFVYTYIDEWDEDLDGEWDYIGQRENGIEEQMGYFCPNCGADMRGDVDERP